MLGLNSKKIHVHWNGDDTISCGTHDLPCQSIKFAAENRTTDDGTLAIQGHRLKSYDVQNSITITKKISLISLGSTSIIKGACSHFLRLEKQDFSIDPDVTLRNFHFINIGAAHIEHGSVVIYNCSFYNVTSSIVVVNNSKTNRVSSAFVEMNYIRLRFGQKILHAIYFNNLTVRLLNSEFRQAGETYLQGHHKNSTLLIVMRNSSFTEMEKVLDMLKVDSAIQDYRTIDITNCTFEKNGLRSNHEPSEVITRVHKVNLLVSDSRFINNTAEYGSALYTDHSMVRIEKGSRFESNVALKSGGAIYIKDSNGTVNESHFINNVINPSQGDISLRDAVKFIGVGGAVANIYKSNFWQTLTIHRSVFQGNAAVAFGGTIFHLGKRGRLVMEDCRVKTDAMELIRTAVVGKFLYSMSTCSLKNVSIQSLPSNKQESVIVHSGSGDAMQLLFTRNSASVNCSRGSMIEVQGQLVHVIKGFTSVMVTCIPCSTYKYNLYGASATFSKHGYKVSPIKCHPCPFGGSCRNGQVKAVNNFWGYSLTSPGEVKFAVCPPEYCCEGDQCSSYNSCNYQRGGTLCGRCNDGYTEDLSSRRCLANDKCHKNQFWFYVLLIGFTYIGFFMYMKEIGYILSWILGLREIKKIFGRNFLKDINKKTAKFHTSLDSSCSTFESSHSLLSGFLKIAFFFYQAEVMVQFQFFTSDNHGGIVAGIKEIISHIFNFHYQGLLSKSVEWCPLPGIHPVAKETLKIGFIAFLLVLLSTIWLFSQATLRLCGKSLLSDTFTKLFPEAPSLQTRIICCTLQFLLLGYSKLITTVFNLVDCVPLGPTGYVLFIDGHVDCNQRPWWQYMLYVVIAIWVVPFPIALFSAPSLLRKYKINLKQFVISLAFPLAVILHQAILLVSGAIHKLDTQENDTNSKIEGLETAENDSECNSLQNSNRLNSNQSESNRDGTKAVLSVLDGPFRQWASGLATEQQPIPWESVFIGRRLLLASVRVFVLNKLVQAYLILLLCILFLVHHVKIFPFASFPLNVMETISLIFLCYISFASVIPAYNYMYPEKSANTSIHLGIQATMDTITTVLFLAIPSIILLIVALLFTVRIIMLISKTIQLVPGFNRNQSGKSQIYRDESIQPSVIHSINTLSHHSLRHRDDELGLSFQRRHFSSPL